MNNTSYQPGYQLAQVEFVRSKGKNLEEGGALGLKFSEINQFMTYYLKDFNEDLGNSILSTTYFLNYLWEPGEEYNYRKLIGRYFRPYVVWKYKNGKYVPKITHFAFSQRELFRLNGHH